ncbi:MAG TPA: complex I subunit 1 family protein [Chthoniobacterales bacterium]|nr:complex I subunit 1 family protein [Chthoniobacterales bacterium]
MNDPLIWISLLKIVGILFVVILPMVSYSVYAERRISAFIQDRPGPNRVGPAGLFQPIADVVKLLLKEDFSPRHVNTFYYWLAPTLAVMPAIITMAVVPFGSTLLGVPMVIADVNIGILYVFAISSLGVYGIVLAGWASNSKYPFLGGVRSSSQMISYELSLGLAVIPIFLLVGTLRLTDVVRYQIDNGWLIAPFVGDWTNPVKWLLTIPMLISFIVFTVAIFAETNRLPFDLPEAEQELAGGYHTEYSSMKFALFFLGEYAAMITGSAVIVTLFLGGWHFPVPSWSGGFHWALIDGSGPGWKGILGGLFNIATFFTKVAALLCFFIWVRWTLPRFRYDQLMRLGWIVFFEVALVNIFIVAGILILIPLK